MSIPRIDYFPVPAAVHRSIHDNFGTRYIPGTTRLYARAESCCARDNEYHCPGHCGIDFAGGDAFRGAFFRAPWDGTIETFSFGPAFGNQLTIVRHGSEVGFFAAHFEHLYVHNGQKVKAGELLARVGSSGQTFGSHVHAEVRERWRDWCSSRDFYHQLLDAQHRMITNPAHPI